MNESLRQLIIESYDPKRLLSQELVHRLRLEYIIEKDLLKNYLKWEQDKVAEVLRPLECEWVTGDSGVKII